METIQSKLNLDAPVILRISNSGVKAEFEGDKGKIYKNIGLPSLSKILTIDAEFDTGFLPIFGKNYIGVKRYYKYPDKEIIFIEASPANRTVRFGKGDSETKEFKNVAFPGLLMAITMRVKSNGQLEVANHKLFATPNPIIRDSDQLYRFPFGNVYSDGGICWGNINPSKNIRTLTQAAGLLDEFLYGRMNSDLYSSGRSSGMSLEKLLESLQDKPEFTETLTKTDLTFRDLASMLKSKNVG